MFKINDLKQKLAVTAVAVVYILVLYAFDVPCVILSLTGFKCPGCGMTRALLAALRLDFEMAFYYNRMFWSVPLLYWCFLKDGKPFKVWGINLVLYAFLITGFAINVAFC